MRETAQKLLQMKVPVDVKTKAKWTPLITASHFGSLDCVQLLVNMGADVNSMTSKKYTALHHASEKGHSSIVDFLVKNGAETDAVDNRSRSALKIAKQCGHDKIVEILETFVQQELPEIVPEQKNIPVEAVQEKESKIVHISKREIEEEKITEISGELQETEPVILQAEKVEVVPTEEPKPVKITDSGVSAELIDMVSKLSESNNKGFSMLHIVSKYNNKEMAGESFSIAFVIVAVTMGKDSSTSEGYPHFIDLHFAFSSYLYLFFLMFVSTEMVRNDEMYERFCSEM